MFQILTTVIPGLCESLSSRNLWAASREQRFVKNVLAYQREHPHPEFLQELVLLRENGKMTGTFDRGEALRGACSAFTYDLARLTEVV